MLRSTAAHRAPVDEATAVDRLDAEINVLGNRQIAHG